jgi:ATP-binding cassette subfamily A (ABC1) protein 3
LTFEILNRSQTRNSSNLVFFISVAFALIPANFITIIIKERELNTKHLQIISGITTSSYWISNFIFELLKYFFTGGICLILIALFNAYVDYLILIVFLYGISMVSFTYIISFLFKTESTAQNFVILINFFFGALGGTVMLVLRIIPDTVQIGKSLAFIFRFIPSFAFSFAYNQLLSIDLLNSIDNPLTFMSNEISPISANYAGMDMLFLGFGFIIYTIILIFLEGSKNFGYNGNKKNSGKAENIMDTVVLKEIEKADKDEILGK